MWICRISSLPVESGIPMSISRSNLPEERITIFLYVWEHVCVSVCSRVAFLTKASQGSVHAVRSVCCCHDNHMSSLFKAIHQGQELGHYAPLHFTMGLHKHIKHRLYRCTQRVTGHMHDTNMLWKFSYLSACRKKVPHTCTVIISLSCTHRATLTLTCCLPSLSWERWHPAHQ